MAINLGESIYGRLLAARERERERLRQERTQSRLGWDRANQQAMLGQQQAEAKLAQIQAQEEARQQQASQAAALAGEEAPVFTNTRQGRQAATTGTLQGRAARQQFQDQVQGRLGVEQMRQEGLSGRAELRSEDKKAQLLQAQTQFDTEMQQAVSEAEKDRALKKYLANLRLVAKTSQAQGGGQTPAQQLARMKERRLRADQEIKRVMRSLREGDPSGIGNMLKDLDSSASGSFRSREAALRDIERQLVAKAQTFIELGDDEDFFQEIQQAYGADVPEFSLGGSPAGNLEAAQGLLEQVKQYE